MTSPTPRTKINRSDLKIYPSERLTDNDDGGGMPTGTPLTGEANELFDPIPSIARLNGGFYARSVFAGVLRPDDEPLIGAFTALTRPPKDAAVSYLLFGASRFGESRAEILKRIEAYNVATIESRMTLFSTQPKYSKVVQAYQREDESLPMVGDVYCLRQDKLGYEHAEQYIQITRIIKSEVRTFYNKSANKNYKRMVVQMEISTPLKTDFVGAEYPDEGYLDVPCKIRETGVADAANYYGVKPIAQPIEGEAMQIRLPSIMDKIVPTNQVNTPLADLTAAGQRQTLFDGSKSGNEGVVNLPINKFHNSGNISQLYCGNAVLPSSLIINTSAGELTDKGGTLYLADKAVGSVDYAKGFILINEPSFYADLTSLRFRPAAAELKVADTARTNIDINNRGGSYTINFDPVPAVGTLQVSYRAQGRWYTLHDDGSGVLKGASAQHGSGNINFATGSAVINLTELPDVNSAILWSWGTRATYFNRSGGSAVAKMLLQLSDDADPNSLTLAWNDGTEKTARSDASGVITGDWTGRYDPHTRQIRIDTGAAFNHPEGVLDIKVTYSKGEKLHQSHKAPLRDDEGKVSIDLGDTPIAPNTLTLRWNLLIEDYDPRTRQINLVDPYKTVRDDGNGKLIDAEGQQVGTIDYSRRRLKFDPDTTVKIPKSVYKWVDVDANTQRRLFSHYEYIPAGASMPIDESAMVEVWFYDTSPKSQVIEELNSGQIEIDVLPQYAEVIIPASVNVRWGSKTYFDRQGSLFTDLNTKTGAAVASGTVDYQAGRLLLSNWRWQSGDNPVIVSLVSAVTGNPVDAVTFRTPQSPIRPGSLTVRAIATDGTKVRLTSNYTGILSGEHGTGKVDFEFGVVDIRFGKWVNNDTDAQAKDWYKAANVKGSQVWQPKHVFAESITYNADAYTYLPVNSKVVKIDTVRLPQDGRVPIFRRGDTILITNTQSQDIGSAHTGGQTVQLERDDVDRICVTDSNGKPVNAELWDYDLNAGSITWAHSLDLSDYQMPLTVKHTREERNVILEADIDGTLSLRFATKRAYDIDNTYVSSVLIGDTLRVRASVPFTQRNWDSVWRDTPNGAQLLNKLNLKDYPMALTDDGAITDRWLIKFTSSNQFELYSEALGFVGRFDTLTDLAPINPATQKPYFTIPKQAFGTDTPWASQDVIRFNTWGTLMSAWVLCAVQPTAHPLQEEDGFSMCVFGDTTEVKDLI